MKPPQTPKQSDLSALIFDRKPVPAQAGKRLQSPDIGNGNSGFRHAHRVHRILTLMRTSSNLSHRSPSLRHVPWATGLLLAFVLSDAFGQSQRAGNPLQTPPLWPGGTLTAAPTNKTLWPGFSTSLLAINGSVPSPTIRIVSGSNFTARIENRLTNDLVLHWHGIVAPPDMDGHPRDAVPPGQTYTVDFPVRQRAGTYFYHPHTEPLTGELVYRGLAGAFIVEDPSEATLGLPGGDHDVPLLVQDKRLREDRQVVYDPSMMDTMTGLLGDAVLVNGTPDAYLSVDRSLYRFRLINGSNARVYRLVFTDGRPFQVIATDGGLLPEPASATSIFLGPGERVELLVDFSKDQVGDSVALRSVSFDPGMMGGKGQITMNCTGSMTMVASTNAMPGGMSDATDQSSSHLSGTMTMTCTMWTNQLGGSMGDMHPNNGSPTMNCSGTMTMASFANSMTNGMVDGAGMGATQVTGVMSMQCVAATNHLDPGMGGMSSANVTNIMDCSASMTMSPMTNAMESHTSSMDWIGPLTFTASMRMSCTMDANHTATGMGETANTDALWTMACSGTMDMRTATNAMTGEMMSGLLGHPIEFAGTMICGPTTNTIDRTTGGMGAMVSSQGKEMDVLRLYVDRDGAGPSASPATLVPLTKHDPAQALRTRTFTLDTAQMAHTINGATFDVRRLDFSVPMGDLEIWEFRNVTDEIHPMHPHGALFQVLDRNGNTILPAENRGWKDTVLVWPWETVRVLIRFEAYEGIFVSHCHNLEHEDGGMMQNFAVTPVRLAIASQPGSLAFTFPASATNYVLEVADRLGNGAQWTRMNEVPVMAGGRARVSVAAPSGNKFYRLIKPPDIPATDDGSHIGHH